MLRVDSLLHSRNNETERARDARLQPWLQRSTAQCKTKDGYTVYYGFTTTVPVSTRSRTESETPRLRFSELRDRNTAGAIL